MTTQEWIDTTPGIKSLCADLICHADHAPNDMRERFFGMAIRQFLYDYKIETKSKEPTVIRTQSKW